MMLRHDGAAMIRILAWAFFGLALAAMQAQAQGPVRVASKIDGEGALLGAMIIAMLDSRGIATVDRLQLGPTDIVRRALVAGEVDLYPEYTGNGAFFHHRESDPAWRDAAAGYERVKALDRAAYGLVWLTPAPADNSWVVAVRRDGGAVKLAASAEFVESPAALPAFERAYDFTLRSSQLLVIAGGNTAATMRAAAESISGVNAAMAYGTDGALAALDLVALADPKGAQIVYAPAPVVRATVLAEHPEIADALDPVFRSLDGRTLRGLNARISVDGEIPAEVARDYLRSKSFLR
jgi:osmoprotectant transport system substrate-binding protein